jgi:hypothetical protein
VTGRRLVAAAIGFLFVGNLGAFAGGATTAGTLTVQGDGWQVLSLPYNGSVAHSLFQAPGDLNGDGYDDLLLWRGENASTRGFVLFNGSYSGIDGAHPRFAGAGVPASLSDTGNPFSLDSRPLRVDANGDGLNDVVGWYWAPNGCRENDGINIVMGCTAAVVSQDEIAWGNRTRPLYLDTQFSDCCLVNQDGREGLPNFAVLLPPVRPGTDAAILTERLTPRNPADGSPAVTRFTLLFFANGSAQGPPEEWAVPEPTPLRANPDPPLFLAALDFDRDGLADIVTWSPPGAGPTGPMPGVLTVYNGSEAGPAVDSPTAFAIAAQAVLFGDFNFDGHPDLASYSFVPPPPMGPGLPAMHVNVQFWGHAGINPQPTDFVDLYGPSIFASQPLPKLQLADIDANGRPDFVSLKYDTTSAFTGHLLVDVFLNPYICGDGDPPNPCAVLDANKGAFASFSSEIAISGSDIYASDAGLRLNLQSDFDGDGLRDITVGYFGGNAMERGRTSTSGFVAVMYGRTVIDQVYGVWIDADPGGMVYPLYRDYTITARSSNIPSNGTIRVAFPGSPASPYLEIDVATLTVTSSDSTMVEARGNAVLNSVTCIRAPCPSTIAIPLAFNWSFPSSGPFGIVLMHQASPNATLTGIAGTPRAARFSAATELVGSLAAESDGRPIASGGWVRGGTVVNFTSTLSLQFVGSHGIRPADPIVWVLDGRSAGPGTSIVSLYSADTLNTSLTAPASNKLDWLDYATVAALPAPAGLPRYNLTLSVDASPPQFGDHVPLQSEWITSLPAFVAVQVFDNESGVDPERIELSWENDGAPFVRWVQADYMPGQTAAEVIGHALLSLPEGNLSNVIWRAWDRVGNGPVESSIFGLKVDTANLTFRAPRPAVSDWWTASSVNASVTLVPTVSGIDPHSLEFRYSVGGLFEFGAWSAVPPPVPVAGGIRLSSVLELHEGDANWVQWRAQSIAAADYGYSDFYQIRVDSLRPQFGEYFLDLRQEKPQPGAILPHSPVRLEFTAHEGSPRGFPQLGLDLSQGSGTYALKTPGQADFGPDHAMGLVASTPDNWTGTFSSVVTLDRGDWQVRYTIHEMGGLSSDVFYPFRVNELPTVRVISDPVNFTALVNGTLTLSATATDPEGSPLLFGWAACPSGPTPRPPQFLSNNTSLVFSPGQAGVLRTNEPRVVQVCLVVRDDLDGVVRLNFTIHVTPPPAAPPPGTPPPGGSGSPAVVSTNADAGIAIALLVGAGVVAALVLILRRRRTPPDNL